MATTLSAATQPFSRSKDDLLRIGFFYPSTSLMSVMVPAMTAENPDITNLDAHVAVAQASEEAGFDYIFIADRWETNGPLSRERGYNNPFLYAIVLTSMLAPVTRHIGLACTVHLMYTPPQIVARYGANLDALSGGRWAINMVSGAGFSDGLLPEPARSLDHDGRYQYAAECMDVIKQLWTGAQVRYTGTHIDLNGQLIEPLPLQRPYPGMVSAGASGAGLDFAAKHADYLFFPGAVGAAKAAEFRLKLNGVLAKHGRQPDDVKLLTSVFPIVRESQAEAEDEAARWTEAVDLEIVDEYIRGTSKNSQTYKDLYSSTSSELAELRRIGFGAARERFYGTPRQVAEQLIDHYHQMGVRSVVVDLPVWHPDEIRRFGRDVFPYLREAGIWQPPHERGYTW